MSTAKEKVQKKKTDQTQTKQASPEEIEMSTNCRYCGRRLQTKFEQTSGECFTCRNDIIIQQMGQLHDSMLNYLRTLVSNKTPGGIILQSEQSADPNLKMKSS